MSTDRLNPIRLDLGPRGGPLRGLARLLSPIVERALGLTALARIYDARPPGCEGPAFLAWVLDHMEIGIDIRDGDLERIPREGAAVVVSNHPFGGVEGMILGLLLRRVRPDARLLANFLLERIPELRELFVTVDPFGGAGAARRNFRGLRETLRWLEAGGLLGAFPAGEVAHLRFRDRRIAESAWNPSIAAIVRRARCPVVPVHFCGRNGAAFQTLGLLHPRVRTALLTRELLRQCGRSVEVRIGNPITVRQLETWSSDEEMVGYLRSRSEILAERPAAVWSKLGQPLQPRLTPPRPVPVAAARPSARLIEELARLPERQRLLEADGQEVWIARAAQIPETLHEIGRQREISFRAVGEGTGRDIDLDPFDPDYLHLFVWHREDRALVGAYRLGLTDERLRASGTRGLYTATLFDFKSELFESMGPAVEMGRSFVNPDYQKSYAALLLLWKGIGRFATQNPRYATLFGPVSVSAEYQSASQRLIVSFLEQNRYAHEWSRWVRPRTPPRADRGAASGPDRLRDLDDVSTFISEIETDQKGVPVLLKQYLKLGGRLLGFNVDPAFSNVLDVLIMVDLRQTPRPILARYMGPEGAADFLAFHEAARVDLAG